MNKLTENRSRWAFTALALIACIYSFYQHVTWSLYTNPDAGWLVRTGEYILDHGLPRSEMFSWTNAGAPLVSYQWLFEAIAGALYRFGGFWLVGLAANLLVGILILWVLPTIWMRRGVPAFVAFAVLACVQTPNWFHARPQLISYVLALAFVLLLEKFRTSKRSSWLFALPPLMVLWANVHLLWPFGLLAIGTYLACQSFAAKRIDLPLLLCLAASTGAVCVNPIGANMFAYALSFFTGEHYSRIWELMPAYTTAQGLATVCLFPVAWFIVWKQRRLLPREAIVLGLAMTVMALFIRRFQPLAIVTIWPYLGTAFGGFNWNRFGGSIRTGWKTAVAQAAMAIAVPIAAWYVQVPTLISAWMLYTENSLPVIAGVQKLLNPQDRIFNSPSIGSWLIALKNVPVFVDTQFHAYPKRFVDQMNDCLEGKRDWSITLDRWGVNQLVIKDEEPLNSMIMYRADWQLVLHDGNIAWWMRDSATTYDRLRHWSLTDEQIRNAALPDRITNATIETRAAKYLLLSRQYRDSHDYALASDAARKGLVLMPDSKALQKELALAGSTN